MGLLLWIIFGALAGWIASMVTGNDAQMGAFANIIVGIVGAILGGFLMGLFGFAGITGFDIRSMLVAIGGAILLLWLVNSVRGRRHTTI